MDLLNNVTTPLSALSGAETVAAIAIVGLALFLTFKVIVLTYRAVVNAARGRSPLFAPVT